MDHGPAYRILPLSDRPPIVTLPVDNWILTALSNPTLGTIIVFSPITKG